MNKTEKEQAVAFLNDRFSESSFVLLTKFQGLNVGEICSLRHELRSAGAEFRVIKNTLAKRAIQGTSAEILGEHFVGSTAVTWGSDDPVAAAKVMAKFAKDNPKLEFKSGLLEGKILDGTALTDLSKLPPRDVLLSMLLSALQATPTGMVNVLAGVLRKFIGTIQAIEQEKSKESNS